jgi:succinate-semialdehyde dehydrogenase/glutarate-semialdehyde dehydrogenase
VTTFQNFIAGRWQSAGGETIPVFDKYSEEPVAHVAASTPGDIDAAVGAAETAFRSIPLETRRRSEILRSAAQILARRKDDFVRWIVAEGGQTVAEATREVIRAVELLGVTAEETARIVGELVPLDGAAGGAGKLAFTMRHPLGVVCAITPFNSPLNTPIHKLAPAIAAGNTVVLKPASQTPVSALLLGEVFAEAGLPAGWLNVVTGAGRLVGEQLMRDPRIAFYHFTGSTEVGAQIASYLRLRRSSLELGSIAATIIADDADLDRAIPETARAAFAKAGQVCTSTQIVYAEPAVFTDVCERLAAAARRVRAGNPRDGSTDVGPMISAREAERIVSWIGDAVGAGATLVVGGRRERAVVEPAVLIDPPAFATVICREVFGPVVSVVRVASVDDAITRFNASPYGLSAGLFTRDLDRAFQVVQRLRCGAIHVNSASSSRLDAMPFGGVKESGHGKEGPKYAIREMTEERLIVFHHVAPRSPDVPVEADAR